MKYDREITKYDMLAIRWKLQRIVHELDDECMCGLCIRFQNIRRQYL